MGIVPDSQVIENLEGLLLLAVAVSLLLFLYSCMSVMGHLPTDDCLTILVTS